MVSEFLLGVIEMFKILLLCVFSIQSLFSFDFYDDLATGSDAQTISESRINDRIQFAVMENDRRAHHSALQSLRAAVNETAFKSAKASYFLARQYQMMHENGYQSDSNQSFEASMRFHLNKASKLGNSKLYSSNAIYAQKAMTILNRLNQNR